jgi:hypothetical protein
MNDDDIKERLEITIVKDILGIWQRRRLGGRIAKAAVKLGLCRAYFRPLSSISRCSSELDALSYELHTIQPEWLHLDTGHAGRFRWIGCASGIQGRIFVPPFLAARSFSSAQGMRSRIGWGTAYTCRVLLCKGGEALESVTSHKYKDKYKEEWLPMQPATRLYENTQELASSIPI